MNNVTFTSNNGEIVELPGKWEICESCDGNGSHALHGMAIFPNDGSWDEESLDDYFAGVYDTHCEECKGSGKVVAVNESQCDQDTLQQYYRHQAEESAMAATYAAERRMGA